MLTKKFKKNLIIGWIFIIIVGSLTIIPVLERVILKDKSIFKGFYKDVIMGPFNKYGYGIVSQYSIEYMLELDHVIEENKKNLFREIKLFLKTELKISNVDMVLEDDILTVHTDQSLQQSNEILNKVNQMMLEVSTNVATNLINSNNIFILQEVYKRINSLMNQEIARNISFTNEPTYNIGKKIAQKT
jgi:TRAP-type mannitol/chloroaromatic compound transport system substrate-binding protein